ncbi:MAG: segregation/condensation protein A [Cetobacterium sp.]|uniref:Segregation and condensation protein A n=1 Tax=Cetobacterium ceti TaxID=180163 RepID=A0A1T4K6T1_9FUSO|nr:ScpA family protein [Cetobacterium ceti]MCJ8341980.1 segregation/condensation protein A [Cetobacterium sp.]SJZ38134.1 condensin subunit ScpA [Cetobacterium ceti]
MDLVVKIDNFEGPLDLLLHLIEKKKMKISEIKICQLIDDYVEYLEKAKEDNLEIKVEFLLIASELLEIKALSLLNLHREEEKEKELKRKLEEYKIFKEISIKIGEMENEYNISYSRGEGLKINKKTSLEIDVKDLKKEDIFNIYSKFLNKLPEQIIEITYENKYSLEIEMEKLIGNLDKPKSLEEIFQGAESRTHLVYMFLGILDLYKEGRINIDEKYILTLK